MTPEEVVALAMKLLGVVLELVGPGHAAALMSQSQVDKANAIADAVQYVKFHAKPEVEAVLDAVQEPSTA